MNTPLILRTIPLILAAALMTLTAGCLNGEDLLPPQSGSSGSDTLKTRVATDLIPATAAAAGTDDQDAAISATGAELPDSGPADLTAADESALLDVLAGVGSVEAGGLLSDLLDDYASPGGVGRVGLSRRDVAVLALDVVARRLDLTPEQSFAVRLTRAYLARDEETLAMLLIEQLFSFVSESVPPVDGAAAGGQPAIRVPGPDQMYPGRHAVGVAAAGRPSGAKPISSSRPALRHCSSWASAACVRAASSPGSRPT